MENWAKKLLLTSLFVTFNLAGLEAHITPMVHLKEHNAAIKMILREGQSFYVKNIAIGHDERTKIRSISGWKPNLEVYKFYYGKDSAGDQIGDVLFISVNSKHGPLTLAVGFSPENVVTKVLLTDIPVEPLSWVRKLLRKPFLNNFVGKSAGEIADVINTISHKELGEMTYYYAKVIVRGVEQAVVLQTVLYNFVD